MDVVLVGLNFRTAPIALREKVSFQPGEVPAALATMQEDMPKTELILLSTCNRTELYAAGERIGHHARELVDSIFKCRDVAPDDDAQKHFYINRGPEAAEHLMSVTCGLDSMVVGETEVLGQVKQAYAMATDAESSGRVLHSVFQSALRAAKRVHTETDLCRGRVSVSSVAVDFARKVFHNLASKTVLIVGAGETGKLSLRSMVDRGVKNVLVANRSRDRAEALAQAHGGTAVDLDKLGDSLHKADIVISATGAPHCVITADMVRNAVSARKDRPILLIDIAIPRDIEASAKDIENAYLYDIDSLESVANENLERRQRSIGDARGVIAEELDDLVKLLGQSSLEPLMRHLSGYSERIENLELDRALRDGGDLASLPEEHQGAVRALVSKVAHRILAEPRNALNRAGKNGKAETYARIAADLFKFREEETSEKR